MSLETLLWHPDPMWRDRLVSFVAAICCHVAVFSLGGVVLVQPAEYGIESGGGSIEVNLVAALPGAASAEATVSPASADMPSNETDASASARVPTTSPVVGDGSSPIPGMDATTLHAGGGAWTTARPGRFRNLAPRYPELARKLGQEGLVTLLVKVDKTGRPTAIDLKQSSGFPLLDDAAIAAVRRWTFEPARAASLQIESTVEVPIRFRLEENQ